MDIKTQHWINELDHLSEEIKASFGSLEKETLFLKPDSKTWSIAENLEHLITVNSSYFPIFKQLIDNTFVGAFIGKFSFFTKLFGNMIYRSVSDGGKKKIRTFPLWEPKIKEGEEHIIEKFLSHQDDLKNWIKELGPYIEKEAIIHSPANKLIVYSLPQALDIMVAHEKRHLQQAKNVLNIVRQ
ncbi:DinB family protein [Cecembia calidifontis]|uniref:DinB family protein n=1 Tax=Cecembia calidifontis TaxID=1187080 RepID=A0A4Q7PAV1_9BACT|nr:DinB family protein [Cecembia calidifontis]RZS97403.1 DinB family protein [Cecembia calidifontis]